MSTSTSNEHSGQGEPVQDANTQSSENENGGGNEYVAPFTPFHGVPLKPNYYMVTLHDQHTPKQHWEAIGEDLGVTFIGRWYSAFLTVEQRERIRRDPGVTDVTQYGKAVW